MNRELFAKALSTGVQVAYSLSFEEALSEIERFDMRSGDVSDHKSGAVVHWSLVALQVLEDTANGRSVEVCVSAVDGYFEERIYVYVRELPRPMVWSVYDRDEQEMLDELAEERGRDTDSEQV